MDAISGDIRLAHERDTRPIAWLAEWHVDILRNFVLYRPLGLGFFVWNTGVAETDIPATDYVARLAHFCDGGDMPELGVIAQLGKDAIHAFILEVGDDGGTPLRELLERWNTRCPAAGGIAGEVSEEDFRDLLGGVPSAPPDEDDDEIPF